MTISEKDPTKLSQTDLSSSTGSNSDLPTEKEVTFPVRQVRNGIIIIMIGYLIFLLGARPGLFGLDRSKVIGFVQIAVFLTGLAIITLGAYLTLKAFWRVTNKTILADFGLRVVATGYTVCVFTALADVFGFGSHRLPNVFFGPYQANGVMIGMGLIALGIVMMVRFDHRKPGK